MTLASLLFLLLVVCLLCWMVTKWAPEPAKTPLLLVILVLTVIAVMYQLFPTLINQRIGG